ncbi:hypothetical protein C3L33_16877, partial [Rhododendron williamsianum]
MSECWVLREGLKLALDRDLKGIRVVTDSLASVQLIQNDKLGNHDLSNIVFHCRSMLMMLGSEVHHLEESRSRPLNSWEVSRGEMDGGD